MTEEPKERKSSGWVDLVLFLSAPVSSLVAAILGASDDMMIGTVLLLPIPLALAIGFRIAFRSIKSVPLAIILGLFAALGIYLAMSV